LLFALKLVVSIGLISWIVSRADLASVARTLAGTNRWILLLLILVFPIGTAVTTFRWRLLLSTHGVDLAPGYLFRSMLVASFFRQFLPSTVGGDAVRAYDAWRGGASTSISLVALGVDRLLGLLAMVSLATIGLGASPELRVGLQAASAYLAVGGALLAVGVLVLFTSAGRPIYALARMVQRLPRALASPLLKLLTSLEAYQGKHSVLAKALGLSFLLQLHVIVYYYFIGEALGFPVRLLAYFAIVPIALFVMLLPVAINGIGVRESVFIFLLAQYGLSEGQALAFAWLEYSLHLFWALIGGLVYATRGRAGSVRLGAGAESP
jgi:glycosyltransferase 2 family protein